MKKYRYGLRFHSFDGTQPLKGLKEIQNRNRKTTGYYNILIYDRKLTPAEIDLHNLIKLDR